MVSYRPIPALDACYPVPSTIYPADPSLWTLSCSTLSIVLLISATLGSKLVGLVGTLLVVLIVYLWLSYNSFGPGDIFGRFGQLGMGTQLAMGSALLSLLATLCPTLHLPGRRLDS